MDNIILAACRAHTPQFDRLDAEIQKYAIDMMKAALIAAVNDLVVAARCALDVGDYDLLDMALEPFEELIPYASDIEAEISAAIASSQHIPSARSAPSFDPLLGSGGLSLEQGNEQ